MPNLPTTMPPARLAIGTASRRLRPDLPERIHVAIERTIRVVLHERVADCALLLDFLAAALQRQPD